MLPLLINTGYVKQGRLRKPVSQWFNTIKALFHTSLCIVD